MDPEPIREPRRLTLSMHGLTDEANLGLSLIGSF